MKKERKLGYIFREREKKMIKLMIVEDEKIARESIKKLIEKYFSDKINIICECDNGEDAVEKAQRLRPDIILLDIHMPKRDGLSAAKTIKLYLEETEIVIITANSQFEYAQEAIKLKVEDFLVKPYSISSFKEMITKLIEKIDKKAVKVKEEKELQENLCQIKALVEKDFISEMIQNKKIEEKELANYLKVLELESSKFNCIISKIKEENLKKIIACLEKECFHPSVKLIFSSYLDKLIIYVFSQNEKMISESTDKVSKLLLRKDKETSIVISSVYFGSEELIKALEEAKDKLNLLLNSENISSYDIPYDLEDNLFKLILETELKDQFSIINTNIDNIFSYILTKNANCQIDFIKTYMKQLTLMIDRIFRKIIFDKNKLQTTEEIFDKIDLCSTIEEHKEVLLDYIRCNYSLLEASRDKKHVKVIEYAKQYIENNFDKNISLEDVAQHIGLSSNYLSKYFKKVENINFKDYATQIRIEKAKMILETSDGNVTEVAEKLGYTDVSYFSYAFKKKTGYSPKEYYSNKVGNKVLG